MAAPLNLQEGQSSTRPLRFNDKYFYSWWKTRMHEYLMAEDSELWDIVLDGYFVPTIEVKEGEITRVVPKTRQQFEEADRKKIEKNFKAKKLLVCGIGAEEYNRISACESAKEIWDCLRTAHEGTEQVKESKMDMLTNQYENFSIKEGESIKDMYTRFSFITNKLISMGEPIKTSKQVRKILRVLPKSWDRNMVSLKLRTEAACCQRHVFKCWRGKIWLDPNEGNDIRKLAKDGLISSSGHPLMKLRTYQIAF